MKIVIDNIVTEYQDDGQGPVILLLHGWQDSLQTFNALVLSLVGHYRTVRLDLPGFGDTGLPPASWQLDDYISFVENFIEKYQLNVAYLVGHSFGARIILKGVATGRLKPQKLVLIGAAGLKKSNSFRNQAFKVIAKAGKFVTAIPPLRMLRRSLREKLYRRAGSDYLAAGPLKEVYLKIINEDLSQYAQKITVPTLLIWGGADSQTPLADAQFLADNIPHSRLEIFKGGSHFVHREQPEKIAELIKKFCHDS